MNIYEYFNSKTIEQYWRDNHIEPTTWDLLRIVYASGRTWTEKRAAILEIMRERKNAPFPEELKESIEDEIEFYRDSKTKIMERVFWGNRDTSSLSSYVQQFIERMDEIEIIKEKDGEGGFTSESLHMLTDKYGTKALFFFLPISPNMRAHPFEKGDILFDNDYTEKCYGGFYVVADEDEVYRIMNGKGDVELTSDWNPWDCERVKTTSRDNEYGGYYNETTDDFKHCPNTLRLISDYLVDEKDYDLSDLLNNWNRALEQDFPKKKNKDALSEA